MSVNLEDLYLVSNGGSVERIIDSIQAYWESTPVWGRLIIAFFSICAAAVCSLVMEAKEED